MSLDQLVMRAVESELKSMPDGAKAADAVRRILHRATRCDTARRKKDRERVHNELLVEAADLRRSAHASSDHGSALAARRGFLLASIREIEALIVLGAPNEEDILASMVHLVGSLKDGTGYRSLPDVPRRARPPANA